VVVLGKMGKEKLASVSSGGFAFCRWGIMLLVWVAFALKIKELILLTFIIMLLSVLLTVKYAPMIKIWDWTLGVFIKTNTDVLNVKAMKFAHGAGSVLSGICVLLLYLNVGFAWWFVLFFAIMKSISALGFCPASKVYTCMSNGTCCAFSRKVKKMRDKK
jgi:hypothetical protein